MICTIRACNGSMKSWDINDSSIIKYSGLDLWYAGQVSLSRHSESIKIEKIIALLGFILATPFGRLFLRPGLHLKVQDPAWPSVAAVSLFALF